MVTVRLFFNTVLINDIATIYAVYFKDAGGNLFGTSSAIILEDGNNIPQNGALNQQSEISFIFDYTNNNQGGRTPNIDANIVIVASGLDSAQYKNQEYTITNIPELTFVIDSEVEN